ncbi:MAG: hypothetical protein EBT45_06070 [Alphaproteobacteria bacterium]|nr:hypothetical protein [Alphaproteobacteria bacterium]
MIMCRISKILYSFCFFLIIQEAITADLGIECTVFDVGQGSGAVIKDKHRGVSFIVDAGNSGKEEETTSLLRRFNGAVFGKPGARQRVAGVILSHSDGDHVKLLARALDANSRAIKDQNRDPKLAMTAYLGSPFTGYLEGSGKPCLDALKAVNAKIKPLSHVMTSEKAYKVERKEEVTQPPRPFFMNALIPEFSDADRDLSLIIVAANALHGGKSKFLGTENNPGELDEAISDADTILNEGTNNNGAIVKLSYKGQRVTFPGDIDGDHGTDKIITHIPRAAPTFLETDVSLALHHGADRGRTNNIAWLLKNNAKKIIISAGDRGGDFIHPRFSVLYNMAASLRLKARVAPHLIQCGDPIGGSIKDLPGLNEHFCLEDGTDIMIKKTNDIEWLLMSTTLPIYTTKTNGDIQVLLLPDGTLRVKGI